MSAPIPVTYAVEPERNIALARNRALSLARGEKLAFIDDDEMASPFWLSTLLAAEKRYAADVVIGRVDAIYPPNAALWLIVADPLSRKWGPSGTVCTMGSSANALLNRKIIETGNVGFDPAFGRTGGEDTDFFGRLSAAGAKIVVENDAVVREWVSPDRLERAYLCRRAIRAGQSYGAVRLRQLSRAGRLLFMAATLAKALIFSICGTVVSRARQRVEAGNTRVPISESCAPAQALPCHECIEETMRVLHVVRQFSPSIGGLENYVAELAQAQARAGHEPTVHPADRLFADPERRLERL